MRLFFTISGDMLDTISREASSSSSSGTTDKAMLAEEAAVVAVTVTYKIELYRVCVFFWSLC